MGKMSYLVYRRNVHTIAILEIIIKMFVKTMHVDYAKNYTTTYAKGVEN